MLGLLAILAATPFVHAQPGTQCDGCSVQNPEVVQVPEDRVVVITVIDVSVPGTCTGERPNCESTPCAISMVVTITAINSPYPPLSMGFVASTPPGFFGLPITTIPPLPLPYDPNPDGSGDPFPICSFDMLGLSIPCGFQYAFSIFAATVPQGEIVAVCTFCS